MNTDWLVNRGMFILAILGIGILSSVIFIALPVVYTWAQNQHQMITNSSNDTMAMMERGNVAMGFNQNKIIHNFKCTPTGGEIIITALDNSDTETIKRIRNHTLDIQKEFAEGNFTKPFFIHAQQVPGTKVMSEKKDLIKYNVLQVKNGSALILTTNDKQLIDAIRQFMDFQATAHRGH